MTKKRKKTKSHHKSNIVKIQVEAKPARKRKKKRTLNVKNPKVSIERVKVEMQPVLVENFIALQKVMINLANKLDDVSTKVEKLLDLFELSAKTLAKKDFKLAGEASPEIIKKLGEISEQNKIIAKGLTLLHETAVPTQIHVPMPMPAPTFRPRTPEGPEEEYKRSASFKPLKPKTSE
jgi:hypothetical protein